MQASLERFFSHSKLRDQAAPWVMAEAEAREAVVVTYEGNAPSPGNRQRAQTRSSPPFARTSASTV